MTSFGSSSIELILRVLVLEGRLRGQQNRTGQRQRRQHRQAEQRGLVGQSMLEARLYAYNYSDAAWCLKGECIT